MWRTTMLSGLLQVAQSPTWYISFTNRQTLEHEKEQGASRADASFIAQAVNEAFDVLTGRPLSSGAFVQCKLLNETVCIPSHVATRQGIPVTVSAYNPLGMPR